MRRRLEWILPVFQIVVAGALLIVARGQPARSVWGPPAELLCLAINVPAAFVRYAAVILLEKLGVAVTPAISTLVFFVAIALVWYLVSRAIGRDYATPPSRVRSAARSIALIAGIAVGCVSVVGAIPMWERLRFPYSKTAYAVVFISLAWGVSLISYGLAGLWRILRHDASR